MKPKILTEAQRKALRRKVALRDNYRCILHPTRLGNSVHHILHRSYTVTGSALIWQEKNMATLCNECHAECHQHPLRRRKELLERMMELYQYQYNDEPFRQYLIEEET